MATQYSSVPASVVALPFLLARSRSGDLEWSVRGALAAAIGAERAVDTGRRNSRARLAYLLCELGYQLGRRGVDRDQELPIPRVELANALGTSLCRVKRTLALLSLSGIIETDGRTMRVIDWRRLSGVAAYDPARLELPPEEDFDPLIVADASDRESNLTTASGDPACFV
ncbi:MAG: helix-turn-helix domain-containing protein [Pseudomonadota bacterium]|nr:helix-turn-helix domain-containing protein [Pseudomonadota bacterium]